MNHPEWRPDVSAVRSVDPPKPSSPRKYRFGWPDILNALELPNNDESRNRVKNLNAKHNGPIIVETKGSQPKADEARLISWWNGLEELWQAEVENKNNAAATVADTHKYGKNGEVVPGIDGHVKKRRSKKSSSKENKRS
jgi:hypothetical protein